MGRGVKIYEEFVEGAKEGFGVVTRIMPFLVTMLAALAIFRASGMLNLLQSALRPVLSSDPVLPRGTTTARADATAQRLGGHWLAQ